MLVTGGASGVGLSIVKAFASARVPRVVILSRSLETQEIARKELESAFNSTTFVFYQASITEQSIVEEILKEGRHCGCDGF